MKTLIVIPARLESSRLAEKMLLGETGWPLVRHTWEAAREAKRADLLLVATDSQKIVDAVTEFGGEAVLTGSAHASGTDRLGEVALARPDFDILVNVQGDEPEIDPRDIDAAISLLADDAAADMSTLAVPIQDAVRITDPNCVKVILDQQGYASWFSRAPIPWARAGLEAGFREHPGAWLMHLGLYAYRRDALLKVTQAPRPPAEQLESLEQLRALHIGLKIRVGITSRTSTGIDTREDYEAFVSRFRG